MDDVERWIERLAHPDFRVRQEAARLLGLSGEARVFHPLILAIHDASPEVSREAMGALGLLGDARAILPLLDVLRVREHALRCAAGAALSGLGEHGAASRVYRGDLRAVGPLLKVIRDEQRLMSALSAATRGYHDDAPVASVLFAVLTESSSNLSGVAAAESLRQIARREPTPLLRKAVPLLDVLAQFALAEKQRHIYLTASRAVEEAMVAFRDLPLPAGAIVPTMESLPLPAVASPPHADGLPIASVNGPVCVPPTDAAPHLRWWQRWARVPRRRGRHG